MVAVSVNDPAIITQPLNGAEDVGSNYTFTVVAAGTSIHYQWYSSNALTHTTAKVTGQNTSSLLRGPGITAGSAYYFVIVSNTIAPFHSSPVASPA